MEFGGAFWPKKKPEETDPDRKPGEVPFHCPIREDGENIEGVTSIFDIEPGVALVVNEYLDGEVEMFIEKDNDEEPEEEPS